MSNVIAVLRHGSVEQVGSPRDIYERPRTEYVAGFIGSANILRGKALERTRDGGGLTVQTAIGDIESDTSTLVEKDEDVALAVRPEILRLHPEKPAAVQAYEGRVELSLFVGDATNYTVNVSGTEIRVKTPSSVRVRTHAKVFVEFPVAGCTVIRRNERGDAETDLKLSASSGSNNERAEVAQ
jgi:ABC-type Fe3+/spermidine/putrescine transport system ATPase subunit